ncbi:hypothetical protein Q4F19_07245 [Sphingomonas sp. BIUV-7]|uniref:Uncharacterized protein n=1 Tax=Sphingomonas natans TaxID=3063330 RepID=A0ABT8Y775_9SPHN|nr:hypothetical protein [Sphingomonas sp. BIUV-7]
MSDDRLINPEQGAARPRGETEAPAPVGDARFALSVATDGGQNRGRRAGVTKNGEVVGSGAGAGGGGGVEDFDSDPAAGDGRPELPVQHGTEAEPENSNT